MGVEAQRRTCTEIRDTQSVGETKSLGKVHSVCQSRQRKRDLEAEDETGAQSVEQRRERIKSTYPADALFGEAFTTGCIAEPGSARPDLIGRCCGLRTCWVGALLDLSGIGRG